MSALSIPQYGRVPGTKRARRHYPEEGTMTVTLEDRVEVLEGKVEKNLEVLADFRREVNSKLDEFGRVQVKQAQTLDMHTGKLTGMNKTVDGFRLELFVARNDRKEFREEMSGRLERLDSDVTRLQGDVTWLKGTAGELHRQVIGDDGLLVAVSSDVYKLRDDVNGLTVKVDKLQVDVTELKADVAGLKTDVAGLKTDVAGLKAELTEFKVEVRGTLAEILDRLPPKAA
jgi:chromosome segregation ATPase